MSRLQFAQPLQQIRTHFRGVRDVFTLDEVQRSERCCATKWIAAISVAVRSTFPLLHDAFLRYDQTNRKSGAETLGDSHDIRTHIPVLTGKHLPGSANPGLH